jgi:hypothetical protein
MSTEALARRFVELVRAGNSPAIYEELYSPEIVSIEMDHDPSMPHKWVGMEELMKKNEWWEANFTVLSHSVSEPLVCPTHFCVRYDMRTTHKPTGQTTDMSELGVYEVKDGKIVREQYFYGKE